MQTLRMSVITDKATENYKYSDLNMFSRFLHITTTVTVLESSKCLFVCISTCNTHLKNLSLGYSQDSIDCVSLT